jgi:hypothetical protein
MPIVLTDAEARAVAHALDNYLPELRYELARVKLERDRHQMVAFEELLTMLRSRLPTPDEGAEAPHAVP